MTNFRELLEVKVIKPADAATVARLKSFKKGELEPTMAANDGKKLELKRDGRDLDYIFKYQKRWIIDTTHAAARIMQRNSYTPKDLEGYFKRMITKYMGMGKQYTSRNNYQYLFFSKRLNQGAIISYKTDFKRVDNKQHFIIITFLPRGKKFAKPGTEVILLESDSTYDFSPEFMEYVSYLRKCYGKPYECFENQKMTYKPECIFIEKGIEFDIILCGEKLFQLSDFEVIEID